MNVCFIKSLSHLLLLAMLFASPYLYAGTKIIKWVDSKGVTHYGDKPPMPNDARQSSELNRYGVTIEETGSGVEKKKGESAEENNPSDEDQKRYDHALLSTFASIDEIEIARKRNVKIDEMALASLKQKQRALKASAAENKYSNSVELTQLQNLELQIALKEAEIAKVNQRYERDKLRYLELTSKK